MMVPLLRCSTRLPDIPCGRRVSKTKSALLAKKASQRGVSMKKVRCFLAVIGLIATLCGFSLQGMEAGSLANATAHLQTSSVHASSVAYRPYGGCPYGSEYDC